MEVKEQPFNIRQWEAQFPKPFLSIEGIGRGFVEIPVPKESVPGDYLFIRDIHFLYKNSYPNGLTCMLVAKLGVQNKNATLSALRKVTKAGAAYFIDFSVKLQHEHSYWINFPQIPPITREYRLYYKIHYRLISREEFQSFNPELTEFLSKRVITF